MEKWVRGRSRDGERHSARQNWSEALGGDLSQRVGGTRPAFPARGFPLYLGGPCEGIQTGRTGGRADSPSLLWLLRAHPSAKLLTSFLDLSRAAWPGCTGSGADERGTHVGDRGPRWRW